MNDGDDDTFSIDFFWSFRSPYCYLALDRILEIERQFEIFVNVRPVYPMAVRAPGFFKSVNPKYRKYHMLDCERLSEYLRIPYRRPIPDPIIQDMETNAIADEQPYIRRITRLGAAAQIRNAGLPFMDKVARLIWDGSTDDWHEGSHLIDAMNAAGLNGHALQADVDADPDRLEDVIADNQAAHDASDHWGLPLFTFRGETFYGQDRIDVLLWRMLGEGLAERR